MNNEHAMNDKHITSFKVENFKCFESFELTNIGQFNLITGDNNIGKTSILEALLYNKDSGIFAQNLYTSLIYKFQFPPTQSDLLNYFQRKDSKENINFTINNQNKITLKNGKNLNSRSKTAPISLRISDKTNNLYIKPTKETRDIPMIYYGNVCENNLMELYSKYIQDNRSRKQELISALNAISPNIEFLEISTSATDYPTLVVTQSHLDSVVPLAMLGNGVVKLTRILLEIVANSESRLMIDDIASDVHPNRLEDFWKVILWFCLEYDVQLFATTQNTSCLRVFREVLTNSELAEHQKDARLFELEKIEESEEVQVKLIDFEPVNPEILDNQEEKIQEENV